MTCWPCNPMTLATSLTGRPLSLSNERVKSLASGPVTFKMKAGLSPIFSSPAVSNLKPLPSTGTSVIGMTKR